VRFDVERLDRVEVGVEVTRLRVGICPGIADHVHLEMSLRSRGEDSDPVTMSQVVGSIAHSTTIVSARPPFVWPTSSRRLPGGSARGTHDYVSVARELTNFVGCDVAGAELADRGFGHEQFDDRVGHPHRSTAASGAAPIERSSQLSHDHEPIAGRGLVFRTRPRYGPIPQRRALQASYGVSGSRRRKVPEQDAQRTVVEHALRPVSRMRYASGSVAPAFEGVVEAFERNFAERRDVGAAFAAYLDGVPVVDLWGGLADRRRGIPWRHDTLIGIFSGSKGLVAVCLLLLIERGQLALNVPVARYWPEFAANGKEDILVAHLVSHRAGLPGLLTPVTLDEATDSRRMAALLAAQAPIARPEEGLWYHPVTWGWLVGELVRRVSGRSVGRFFAEEVARPLGLEAWIGLPDRLQPRVAVMERAPGFEVGFPIVEREADELTWSIFSNPPRFHGRELAANQWRWRAGEVPSTNAVVTSRSVARLYGCLARGGELDGFRLLRPETVERGRRCLARGTDPYVGEMAIATGFGLQSADRYFGPPPDAYGHEGTRGSLHGAWPGLRVGFSYAPNVLARGDAEDPRAMRLLEALHAAVRGASRRTDP
jgi:CubicO group peptidase (beta-lactamase class C family)